MLVFNKKPALKLLCHGRENKFTTRAVSGTRIVPGWSNDCCRRGTKAFAASSNLQYGGFCTCCGKVHYLFPTPLALDAARELMRRLTTENRIDFDSPAPDPLLHIDYLWTKGPGRMFGVMVCSRYSRMQGIDEAEVEDLVVLKAFSGQMTNYWHVHGWVGPIAGITNATPVYQHYRALTVSAVFPVVPLFNNGP
jgi:hypothetical protein